MELAFIVLTLRKVSAFIGRFSCIGVDFDFSGRNGSSPRFLFFVFVGVVLLFLVYIPRFICAFVGHWQEFFESRKHMFVFSLQNPQNAIDKNIDII